MKKRQLTHSSAFQAKNNQPFFPSHIDDQTVQRKAAGLPTELQSGLESHFQSDFSDVQIHRNSSKAEDLNARAFTQGNQVHFAPGEFNPSTSRGKQLVAHEFAHVQQQREGRVQANRQFKGESLNTSPQLENEADVQANKFSQGQASGRNASSRPQTVSTDPAIQRQLKIQGSTAAKRKKFLDRINAGSTIPFIIDKSGMLTQRDVGPYDPKDIFTQVLWKATYESQTIILDLVAQDDSIFVDSFHGGEVDIDDMLALTDDLFRSSLAHFIQERVEIKDYEKNKGTASNKDFEKAHKKGIKVEEQYFKEKFPKKTIKFKNEGIVPGSKKVDKAGNGTYKYRYDFTDIQQIYTQSIKANSMLEDVVKSEVKIIR